MEINLINNCRACLSEEEEMHYMFNQFDQGITLQEILTSCTNFEIAQDDGFSPYLCQSCTSILVDFYNFKTIYKENQNQIKTLLANIEINNLNEHAEIKTDDNCSNQLSTELAETEAFTTQNEESEPNEEEDYITIKVESNNCSEDESFPEANLELKLENVNGQLPEEHQYILQGETEVEYEYQQTTCPECGEIFLSQDEIQEHMSSKHNLDKSEYMELSEISLLKIKKVDDKTFFLNKCKFCNQYFDTAETYKEHLEMHKKNVCDICGVGFTKKSYLKDHQEIHCSEKKHICNYCHKAFKRRTVLVKHKRIHTHPRECICEVCGKAFNDKGTLKTHIMLLHLKERNYMCLICGVKFPLKATLEKHILRHQNKERQFYCSQCPLGYKDKSSLDRHMFIKHSGHNVKSTCSACGKQYATSSSLLKHQRVHHTVPSARIVLIPKEEIVI